MNLSISAQKARTSTSSWALPYCKHRVQFSPLQNLSLIIQPLDIESTPHDNQRPAQFRMDSFTMKGVSDYLLATRRS